MAMHSYIGWEAVGVFAICMWQAMKRVNYWTQLLFSVSSIVNYWRIEMGGKPDDDDPFELGVPLTRFKKRCKVATWMSSFIFCKTI